MTLSISKLAYDDCYAVMDAALADDRGIAVKMESFDAANHFRMRCHQARKIDRSLNAETYEKGHALHRASQYDRLTLKIRNSADGFWLVLERTKIIPGEVVSLTTNEPVQLDMPQALPPPTILALPPPTVEEIADSLDAIPVVEAEPVEGPKALPEIKGSFRRV